MPITSTGWRTWYASCAASGADIAQVRLVLLQAPPQDLVDLHLPARPHHLQARQHVWVQPERSTWTGCTC